MINTEKIIELFKKYDPLRPEHTVAGGEGMHIFSSVDYILKDCIIDSFENNIMKGHWLYDIYEYEGIALVYINYSAYKKEWSIDFTNNSSPIIQPVVWKWEEYLQLVE